MRAALRALKSVLIGGVVFLLPIGVVLIVFGKLLQIARRIAQGIHDAAFPNQDGNLIPLAIAILVLIGIAFAAGAFARTRMGRRIFALLERAVLANLPVYPVLKQTLDDMAGGSSQLSEAGQTTVVQVRLDDMTVLGFLIDRRDDGMAVVFLPGAPSALSGSVAMVEAERIVETELTLAEVMQGMRRLGSGLVAARGASKRGG